MQTWVLSTVGRSLASNWRDWMSASHASENGIQREPTAEQLSDYLNWHLGELREYRKSGRLPRKIPSEELQTLWLLLEDWEHESPRCHHAVRVALFPTEATRTIAEVIIKFLNDNSSELEGVFGDVSFDRMDQDDLQVCDVDPDPALFAKGIANLANQMSKYIDEQQSMPGTVYIDPTGGFKASWIIWPLVGARYPEAVFIDSQPTSTHLMRLPRFPLAADVTMISELHSFLEGHGIPGRVYKILPFQVQSLFHPPLLDLCTPNFFGDVFRDLYEKRNLVPDGSGSILLKQIGNQHLVNALESHIPAWQNVWIGDQLPETVDHGKRHSLRLMEFAVEALPSLDLGAIGNDAGLFVLFASLWLHDIGHTAMSFDVETEGVTDDIPIDKFPSLVRDWHAESSSRLISETDYYLSPPDGRDLVAAVAQYHRQRMPLRSSDVKTESPKSDSMLDPPNESLEQVASKHVFPAYPGLRRELRKLDVDNIVAVEALLRFLDATDVQAARVFDESYARARLRRTNEEVECLLGRLKPIGEVGWDKLTQLSDGVQEAMGNWESLDMNPAGRCSRDLPAQLLGLDRAIGKLEKQDLALAAAVLGFSNSYSDDVGRLSRDQRFVALEELSLIDRMLFKYRQHIHFQKHASVEYCWYRCGESGLRVYLEPSSSWSCFAPEIASDIYAEVAVMSGELERVIPFDGVWNAWTEVRFAQETQRRQASAP